ncbi:MAG: 2-hydroxychromene-2-carboxylate isomerase [Burkholderiales bacterium]
MSLTTPPEVYFDFGSPNAYLAHQVIPAIEQRTGCKFDHLPILLGGLFKLANNRSPMEAFAGVKNKLEYERREMKRFILRHQIAAFKFNPHFPVNTLHIMRGAVAARQSGQLAPYADAMFAAMWEQGRKLDDPAVIHQTLREAGLDADALIAASQDAQVKQTLIDETQQAFERGVFGAPTFFVGDEMFFGKDRLRDVEEEVERVQASH